VHGHRAFSRIPCDKGPRSVSQGAKVSDMVTEIDVNGEWYEAHIEYEVVGRYIHATRIDPEEYPEVEWTLTKAIDAEGSEVTDKETLRDIENAIAKSSIESDILESEAYAAQQARADREWDEDR